MLRHARGCEVKQQTENVLNEMIKKRNKEKKRRRASEPSGKIYGPSQVPHGQLSSIFLLYFHLIMNNFFIAAKEGLDPNAAGPFDVLHGRIALNQAWKL